MSEVRKTWSQMPPEDRKAIPWYPGTLLVVRALELGPNDGVQLLLPEGPSVVLAHVSLWPKGRLSHQEADALGGRIEEAAMNRLVHTFGVSSELFEAFG